MFFVKKKKEKNICEGKTFSRQAKFVIAWIIAVLVVNTFNYLAYNIWELVIYIDNDDVEIKKKQLQYVDNFTLFWFDILNLTNGVFFLYLIKSMSLSKKKKKV